MKAPKKDNPKVEAMVAESGPWIEWLTAQGRSACTTKNYGDVVRRFAQYHADHSGPQRLRDVQRSDLETWLRFLIKSKYSSVTIGCYLHPLLGLFFWLEQRGAIFLNPCRHLEVAQTPRRLMSVPTEADMHRLVNSVTGLEPVDLRDRAILEVAYASGFRCRELIALDLHSVDLTQGIVQVIGKGARERKGLLTRAAVSALRKYLSAGRPVLLGEEQLETALWLGRKSRKRIRAVALRNSVKARARRIGLKITPHDIRRAFATHLLRHGATPLQLQRLLGHISCRHLQHYLRYAPEELLATHRLSCLGQ